MEARLLPAPAMVLRFKSSVLTVFAFVILCVALPHGQAHASGGLRIDFNQAFYVHPGHQTWDFCVVRPDSVYHLYYHAITEACSHASCADTIFHATSPDLCNWELVGAALTVGPDDWDAGAIWAPDVVRDEPNQRWVMAYTGVDTAMNQRICLAYSDDLYAWTKSPANPVIEPDPDKYIWDPEGNWSDFRDPFLYRQDDVWHILVTAKKWLGQATGVLYHATSSDLQTWTDVGPFFYNDGATPQLLLESPQYYERGGVEHLLFGEFDTIGTSHVVAEPPDSLSMTTRTFIDDGYAPEVDQFDPDVDIFSRLAVYQKPGSSTLSYVIRFDTLLTASDGRDLLVHMPHPLQRDFDYIAGAANFGNPTFGDNPVYRGEPSVGVVGNGYYGSGEYYMGPLSNAGQPGTFLGPHATGTLKSYPFVITGLRLDFLIGGGYYPQTCYIALMDAETDTVIFKETGRDDPYMTPASWSLAGLNGRLAYIKIVDVEVGTMGFINLDEIIEVGAGLAAAPDTPGVPVLRDLGPAPNPFNPATVLRFESRRACKVEVRIIDLRGRQLWTSQPFVCQAGANAVTWRGQDQRGHPLPAGTYLYTLETPQGVAASGKLCLVK